MATTIEYHEVTLILIKDKLLLDGWEYITSSTPMSLVLPHFISSKYPGIKLRFRWTAVTIYFNNRYPMEFVGDTLLSHSIKEWVEYYLSYIFDEAL